MTFSAQLRCWWRFLTAVGGRWIKAIIPMVASSAIHFLCQHGFIARTTPRFRLTPPWQKIVDEFSRALIRGPHFFGDGNVITVPATGIVKQGLFELAKELLVSVKEEIVLGYGKNVRHVVGLFGGLNIDEEIPSSSGRKIAGKIPLDDEVRLLLSGKVNLVDYGLTLSSVYHGNTYEILLAGVNGENSDANAKPDFVLLSRRPGVINA